MNDTRSESSAPGLAPLARTLAHAAAMLSLAGVAAAQQPIVIKFSHVSKRFTLHHERPRSVQEMVVNLFGLRNPSKWGVAMPRPAREDSRLSGRRQDRTSR